MTLDDLPLEEANRIRRVAKVMCEEAIAHVGLRLNEALEPLPAKGPITLDGEWLRGFAASDDVRRGGGTDYLYARAFGALDREDF